MERAEFLKRRKEIYEAKPSVTKHGGDRKSEKVKSNGNNFHLIPSFSEDTAAKTGLTSRSIRQEVQIATDRDEEVKGRLKEVGLDDHKTGLLEIARCVTETS